MSGHINLIKESLEELDRLDRDLLILTFFEEEKPLRGLNGLCDWRMNGRLSELLIQDNLQGRIGEKVLMSTNKRIKVNRMLMLGLGSKNDFDNMAFVKAIERIFKTVKGLQCKSLALNIPGSHIDNSYLLERLAILMKEIRMHYSGNVSLLVGGNESFRDIRGKFDLILEEVDKVVFGKSGVRN